MKKFIYLIFLTLFSTALFGQNDMEIETFYSPNARQAVAVSDDAFFAINNTRVVKYSLEGDSLISTSAEIERQLIHMNSGVVHKGKLYCAHSNYPDIPMHSSVEVFNTRTLEHIGSISFGIEYGSCTWVLPNINSSGWYVFFAHYENRSQAPGKDVSWSQLIEYDSLWNKVQGWVLPAELVKEIRPYSLSGAVLIDNKLYCTGHDDPKAFILEFPVAGSIMEWTGIIDIPFEGQGIAMDKNGDMWGIRRKKKSIGKAAKFLK